jgi:hypothetical protein
MQFPTFKKLIIPLLIPFLFLSFSYKWNEFKTIDGRFYVMVPGIMEEKITKSKTAIGELEYHTFVCQIPESENSENLLYIVSYCDYPKGTIHSDSTEFLKEYFEATIDEATRSIRGQLLYAADCKIDDYPGKTWRIDYNNGKATMRTKSFMVKNRLFSLQTACRRVNNLNEDGDKFFDSFRLMR